MMMISKVAYYRNNCDYNQILHSDKHHQTLFVDGPNTDIQMNQKWRTAGILKINRKIAISQQRFDRSPRNLHGDAN